VNASSLNIVVLGLAITSSWGNGHATTYRGLLREMRRRGHRIRFLERDVPWYASHRDLPKASYCDIYLYRSPECLKSRLADYIRDADVVIVGSFVPDGIEVAQWVCATASGLVAFYDIDTPVTLSRVERGSCEYLSADLIQRFHLYLSFTGGPTLKRLEKQWRARRARPLYCSVDPAHYFPEPAEKRWDLGYLGTYSEDRQPSLEALMLAAARRWRSGRFVVAGSQYPDGISWPGNVQRITHLAPVRHRHFYNQQHFTLNLTRADMRRAGYSPSVRLFEASACGVPIISDNWEGLDDFLERGSEVLIAHDEADATRYLLGFSLEERAAIGEAARRRVLRSHTAAQRATELEEYLREAMGA
jgi:spore maturation protein CgeB